MHDPGPLQRAIAQLEALRGSLGDVAVEAAIQALRQHAPNTVPAVDGQPEQRLRQVSVLFADIADSTAMLGRVGPEDTMDLVDRALQDLSDAVHHWGGAVLRFTGDGLKAAFGTQGLREDEAERAVRAGLDILARAERHAKAVQRELGIANFGVRVGIHTGPVLLGGGVEAERTAMGHAVNLAARMEQSAPVGCLRVSETTWSQVRGLFVAEAQPPLQVKGHDEPLATWLVTGVAAGPEPTVQRGIDGVAPPMIGRETELAELLALHGRAVSGRQLVAAQVIADAGVGKTRLRQELLAALSLSESSAGLLQARAHPSSLLQPYGLLHQLVVRWLGIREDLSTEQARRQLNEGLVPWLGDQASAKAARIGQLIGLDFSADPAVQALGAAALRSQAFEALREALIARARHAPLLLVLDDLHWADDASLEFVQTLLLPADVPLMLLMLARPTLLERGVALQPSGAIEHLALRLEPLGTDQGQALVDALLQPLQDAPAALRKLLLERGAGNPFFLEALVRMLIDDGVIDARAQPWRLHPQRLASLRVPPTLVGVLQARLDALPASELLALQSASIVGTQFWSSAADAVSAGTSTALPALEQRTLIVPRPGSSFAQTAEHAFSHQLLHDTTYDTVLKPQRREGHARAARWLAERVTDRTGEFLGVTAEHYERAGDSAQALEYWDRAQHDAFNRYANAAAAQFIERALAQPALTDARWRLTLLSTRYEVLDRMGRSEEATQACEAMAAWAEHCNNDAMRADVATTRMLRADHDGRPEEALALAEQTLALALKSGDASAAAAAALAHGELAWLALLREDFAQAEHHVAAGLIPARAAAQVPRRQGGDDGMELKLHAIAIEALNLQERYVDVLDAVEQGLVALDRRQGSVAHHRFNLLSRQSVALRHLGRLAESLECGRHCLAVARDTGIGRLQAGTLGEIADTALLKGDLGQARQAITEHRALATTVDNGYSLPTALEHEARLAQQEGRTEAARAAWQEALELYSAQSRTHQSLQIRCELALIDFEQGQTADAMAALDAVWADVAQDPRTHRRALLPPAMLACHRVLNAAGDERAATVRDDLRVRLAEQLQALPDEAARQRLVNDVPFWRTAQALLEPR